MSEMVVRGRGESGACVGVVHFERESTRARKGSRSHSNQSMYVPDVREVGDRCRDFVIALTPHPITCVRKCRAAILNLDHAPVVVLCTLTSTRMRHPTNLDVENQNSQLGPHRLGEGGDDHKERWFGKARTIGAKLKSQSRGVLNPPFQIETIDGPARRRPIPCRRLHGLGLRFRLRDGAGKP